MTYQPPNILFIMSDDHASHAISSYGSSINQTPNIDRIAEGGIRFDNCFCTNAICTPSRATILTGTYNHVNAFVGNFVVIFVGPGLCRQSLRQSYRQRARTWASG